MLRDRRHLAGDGLVVPVVVINGQTGEMADSSEVVTRGLAIDPKHEEVLRDLPALLRRTVAEAPVEERTDPGLIKDRVRQQLQREFRRRVGRRPLVLPVVMDA